MGQRSIKIHLDVENTSGAPALFAGDRQRLATATDVVFLGPRALLVAHLVGQSIHLLTRRRWSDRWRITDSVVATAGGAPTMVDLLSWHAPTRRLAVSNCRNPSATIYRVDGRRIVSIREIPITDPTPGFTHGVEWHPDGRHLAIINSGGSCKVRVYDVETGTEVYAFDEPEWRPKDAAFLDARHLVVPMCSGSPTPDAGPAYGTRLALVRLDLDTPEHEIVAAVDIPGSHTDGVFAHDGDVFVADQTSDVVRVYRATGAGLEHRRDIAGIGFPHGIAADRHRLAITSYEDASLNLCTRNATSFEPELTYTASSSKDALDRYRQALAHHRDEAERAALATPSGDEA